MTIRLTLAHYQEILAHALSVYPVEACGLLAGTRETNCARVRRVYPMTNVDRSPQHFTLDPKEQFTVLKDVRKNSYRLLGNFHSHPSTSARPSEEDKRLALDKEMSYLILSLADKTQPVLKCFSFKHGLMLEETLLIEEQVLKRELLAPICTEAFRNPFTN
ncbi:CysO-cysteine peptidase [Peptococcaceae bacterium CEB3]|nr:CysO-cysteine peptidase [Peptococcaceae bacterium CEB3]